MMYIWLPHGMPCKNGAKRVTLPRTTGGNHHMCSELSQTLQTHRTQNLITTAQTLLLTPKTVAFNLLILRRLTCKISSAAESSSAALCLVLPGFAVAVDLCLPAQFTQFVNLPLGCL